MKKIIVLFFLLTLTIAFAATISVNVSWQISSTILRPASVATISLTITNPGVDLTDVIVTASPGPYVKILSGSRIELGSLSYLSSAQASISIKIDENAVSTNSYVYLEVDYKYTGETYYKKILYIPITIIREPIIQIKNVKFSSDPEPGKTIDLSFDLVNDGMGDAKDVSVSIASNSNFLAFGSNEVFLNDIKKLEGKTVTFPLSISPDASVGMSSIPIKISYYDETRTNYYNQTKEVGIKISGNIDFIATVSSYSNFYYGSIGKVTISIANRGTAPANFITVKASSDYGSKEFYIGSLDSDDSDTIELQQDLTKAKEKYVISLLITYRDKFDNSYSVEKFVEVIPENAPLNYNVIIVGIFILAIVYLIYRKKKK
ncbi:MAG: hypothetical protein QXD55_00785 [Candidatus Aenigmatarchaeota archaeon]